MKAYARGTAIGMFFMLCGTAAVADEFCDGFEKGYITGYKQAKNTSLEPLVPLCPLEPLKKFGDPDSDFETGVDTLHVWAYPASACVSDICRDPIFLGATAYGGKRPDVAAIFGDRFRDSGYGITVDSLPAGTYDLAVFAWSTATGGFVPAKVVRVTVKKN